MKSAIEQAFDRAAREERCTFIPFMTGGFPDPDTCRDLLSVLDENGADVIEIGLPFSDPLADGPVIQRASKTALDNGTTPAGVLDLTAWASKRLISPIIIMTYWNPVLKMGPAEFAVRAVDAGTAGVIIPDLPPEEADEWLEASAHLGLETVFMVAPTTPPERRLSIMSRCRGFLYYVSLTGVTGSDVAVSPELVEDLDDLRRLSPVPVAVGFGVSTPDQAHSLSSFADGVIVGSALIRAVLAEEEKGARIASAARLAASLSRALRRNGTNLG
ncbi:MAG: tryptophan synthase subunit alpha [Proteobacteria bacterium]|nr:tryptophan synthase subunit alpha [Pseudomonadota bacterium]